MIAARYENYGGKSYTSARLNTKGKRQVKYGLIEARIRAPRNRQGVWDPGCWPAFWMLGARSSYWPYCGEIDIFEMTGKDPRQLLGGCFWSDYIPPSSKTCNESEFYTMSGEADDDYHVYSIAWDEKIIRWYVDGTYRLALYHKGLDQYAIPKECQQTFMDYFYMILNVAVGGNWEQVGTPNPANYPQFMEVDWVRVWSRNP
ncbi:MAG: hypothetical protein A2X46_04085 [Lentisphaerae bacterium GWF2_57_35]|nr:MAG: hypothetical protein A2X46_04085 [Lentisphaerae bacterium GWF2_57_35]